MSWLAVNAAVLAGLFLIAWLVCVKLRDVTPVDSLWAFGMVLLAGASFVQADGLPGPLHRTRPGYADYVRRTSGFVPWLPRT